MMSTLPFTKMHGLGNDFVVIDTVNHPLTSPLSRQQIQHIANRRTGIGCDQLLIIALNDSPNTFDYLIYNADGSRAEQCGNGARCVGRYLFDHGMATQQTHLNTVGGLLHVEDAGSDGICVELPPPNFLPSAVAFSTQQPGPLYQLEIDGNIIEFGVISLGNPHMLINCDDIQQVPVTELGPLLSQHHTFANGVNCSWYQVTGPDQLTLRTYERGAGETQSCGSAACAAVVVAQQQGNLDKSATEVILPLGSLTIEWQDTIRLTGPAETVYLGDLVIK